MKHIDPNKDYLQELLRQHILDKEKSSEAESLFNQLTEKAFESAPEIAMSEAQKAKLIASLKPALPFVPPPGPAPISPWLKFGIPGTVIVIGTILSVFLLMKPNRDSVFSQNNSHQENSLNDSVQLSLSMAAKDSLSVTQMDLIQQAGPGALPILSSAEKISYGFPVPADSIGEGPAPLPTGNLAVLLATGDRPEIFQFKGEENKVILAREGTLFYFPAGCFSYDDGTEVRGEITLKVGEYYKNNAFIRNHLHSAPKEGTLQTAGMIFLEASQKGKKLKVSNGMSYYVEFADNRDQEFKIYHGAKDANGKLQMAHDVNSRQIMVPLPLADLNFLQFLSPERGHNEWDNQIRTLNQARFEGTFIATREFVERLTLVRKLGYPHEVLEMYLDNISLPLYKVDESVAYYLRGNYSNYKNLSPSEMGQNYFQLFADQQLTHPLVINHYGVNLTSSDCRSQMAAKGASKEEIESALICHFLKNILLKEINEPLNAKRSSYPPGSFVKVKEGKQTVTVWNLEGYDWTPLKRSRGFQTRRTGYVLLGGQGNLRSEGNALSVTVPSFFHAGNAKVFATIDGNRSSVAEGEFKEPGTFILHDIPSGSNTNVILVGIQNGNFFFGSTKVSYRDRIAKIEPGPRGEEELNLALAKVE